MNLKEITVYTPPPDRVNIMYTNLIIRQLELPQDTAYFMTTYSRDVA